MSLQTLAAELADLEASGSKGFDIEAFANGHAKQLEVLRAARITRRILLMMARQAGKSWFIFGALTDAALRNPGSTSVFLGLSGPAVRNNFWEVVWKPQLAKWGIDCTHNEMRMVTTFANGSRCILAGTDDIRHVQNLLGNRFKAGVVAIDESQSQPRSVLKALLVSILPPMLTPESRLILAGTIPEVPAGIFWEEYKKSSWTKFAWGRLDNLHTPEAAEVLRQHLADNHLTLNDPQIRRDWYGEPVFDVNARTYFYRPEINGYKPITPEYATHLRVPSGRFVCAEPWPGIDRFAVAIDPGGHDPAGITCIGWGRRSKKIQELFSWVSDRNARHTWSEIASVAAFVQDHYRTGNWFYDSTSDNEQDTFGHEYGLPVVCPAKKADMGGQIRRYNDLLGNGTFQVIEDSPLAEDLLTSRLDVDALANGQHRWSTDYHPTNSECARYALGAYWLKHVVPREKAELDPFEVEAERIRIAEKYQRPGRKPNDAARSR